MLTEALANFPDRCLEFAAPNGQDPFSVLLFGLGSADFAYEVSAAIGRP